MIDLQEGFAGNPVVLRIDGQEVYRASPKTRMQIGLADSRTFDLPPQEHVIEFEMPETGASRTLTVNLVQDRYLGVSVEQDKSVSLKDSLEPFGYL
ncbi:MAG: hypothetical protein ACRD44_15740 [Bryobacteraceae bacterium]